MAIKAATPVLRGYRVAEAVYGRGNRRFEEMPAVRLNEEGDFLARFILTDEEFERVCETGEIFVVIHTRGNQMQPVTLLADAPRLAGDDVEWPDRYAKGVGAAEGS